jgi:hypothetical protein
MGRAGLVRWPSERESGAGQGTDPAAHAALQRAGGEEGGEGGAFIAKGYHCPFWMIRNLNLIL